MSPLPPPRRALDVLLVDDDPIIRKGYSAQLRGEGWNVQLAGDGYEALQLAGQYQFDVILLDLRMPYRNGAEVLHSLRGRRDTADTPVFLLAQPGDSDLVDRAMHEGADGIFEKSRVGPRDIAVEVVAFLDAGGRTASAAAPPAAAPVQPSAPAAAAAGASVPQAVDEIARRFRKPGSSTLTGADPRDPRETRDAREARATSTGMPRDAEASARAVAKRLSSRESQVGESGWPQPARRSVLGEAAATREYVTPAPTPTPPAQYRPASQPLPPPPPMFEEPEPEPEPEPLPPEPVQAYNTVLNRMLGEAGRLAAALGLPVDFTCPVCRQQLVLRLWPDQEFEAGVRGHFWCPRCMGG